jgi:hypothetical protein
MDAMRFGFRRRRAALRVAAIGYAARVPLWRPAANFRRSRLCFCLRSRFPRVPSGYIGNEGQPDDCPSKTMNSARINSTLLQ